MDNITNLSQIDFKQLFIWFIMLLVAVKFLIELFGGTIGKLLKKLDIETKAMREKREQRELLTTTAQLAKTTAENLDKLQKRHTKDEENFRNNLNNYMEESRKDRKALHDEMKQFSNNRVSDRQQSLEIQKELKDSQVEISNKVKYISSKLDEMKKSTDDRFSASEEKENKRVQSEIKERIAQSYREYHKNKQISSIELEALEDLITTYELHGGENSCVHSLVQKEMYTWEVE